MFTDIVGSTPLRDALVDEYGEKEGDRQYRERILNPHNDSIRTVLQNHRGFEVKTIGDSFMVAFAHAEDAVVSAVEIQRSLRAHPIITDDANRRLAVRIGIHTGSAEYVEHEGKPDYDGHAVNIAARVEGLLKEGERIYCSRETTALAKASSGIRFLSYGHYLLKGLSDKVEILEVLWHEAIVPAPPTLQGTVPYPWLTKWVGRDAEMSRLEQALRQDRLVTLLGPGGVGKTRMAVETLLARGGGLPKELVFVPLEQATESASGLLGAIRDALGLTEVEASDFHSLRRQLHGGDRLLILDNFESVMRDAGYVSALATAPGVRLIVTSQQALGVIGERIVKLEPMTTTGDLTALESYQLLVSLVQQRDANWQPDDSEAMHEVLEATDGLPYLIELVAAVAPKRKLRQLVEDLKTRVREVRARTKDASRKEQHTGVQACLEWALLHLQAEERQAIRRLAVFGGEFDANAASEITATSVASLDVLVDACLLRFDRGSGRYSMLSTTRQFANGTLPADELTRLDAAHAQWFIEHLEYRNDVLQAKGGEAQRAARRWIDAELENVLQAVAWAEKKDPRLYSTAVVALSLYLRQTGRFSENLRLHSEQLHRLDPLKDPYAWAMAQSNLANAYCELPTGDRGDNAEKAIASCEMALRVYNETDFPLEWAGAQNNLGSAYRIRRIVNRSENLAKAIVCYEAALRVYEERGELLEWAISQNNLGNAYKDVSSDRGLNVAKAINCYNAALEVYNKQDFPLDWAMTQSNLGLAYGVLPTGNSNENVARAIAYCEAALQIFSERDFPVDWATAQHNLGFAYSVYLAGDRAHNIATAIACYESALRVYNERDSPIAWATTQENLGNAYTNLPTAGRGRNIMNAIACYQAAARGYTKAGLFDQAGKVECVVATLGGGPC